MDELKQYERDREAERRRDERRLKREAEKHEKAQQKPIITRRLKAVEDLFAVLAREYERIERHREAHRTKIDKPTK
jgi:hypothetical protein